MDIAVGDAAASRSITSLGPRYSYFFVTAPLVSLDRRPVGSYHSVAPPGPVASFLGLSELQSP
ncbi:hypothetical protein [Sphingopyxis terrae]|uniref:hypothetical protein n=1 Tax=Sphingopyxis terrae TaxID=33052 RepID=UPI00363D9BDB